MENKQTKSVYDSLTESSYLLFPRHMNAYGKLFGGQHLEWIDMLAGIVAMRHSNSFVVTASISEVQFLAGIELTEILYLRGYVCAVGHSSMELVIESYAEKVTGEKRLINKAYATMVAVDSEGKAKAVPPLSVEDEFLEEHRLAVKRRAAKSNR